MTRFGATVTEYKNVSTKRRSVYGSGNAIIIGSHSFQSINNQKDDLKGLIAAIGQLGFQQAMLLKLREAVQQDQETSKEPNVTVGRTGEWFGKALKEARRGS